MLALKSCRSLLFTPANLIEKYPKVAKISGCDALIFDLEDALASHEKEAARETMLTYLSKKTLLTARIPLLIRINGLDTPYGLQDILALLEQDIVPSAIMLPKV